MGGLGDSSLEEAEADVFFVDDAVALAGGLLEAFAVPDGDEAAGTGDEAGLLQDAGGGGDGGAAGAEHDGEKFLGDGETIALHAVLAHQEPARETRFERVHAIAGGGLGGLGEDSLDEAQQAEADFAEGLGKLKQDGGFDAEAVSGNLHADCQRRRSVTSD